MFYLQSENQRLVSLSAKHREVMGEVQTRAKTDPLAMLNSQLGKSDTDETQQVMITLPQVSQNELVKKTPVSEIPGTQVIVNKTVNAPVDIGAGDNFAIEKSIQSSPPVLAPTVLMAQNTETTKPKVEIAQGSTIEIIRKQLTPKSLAKQKMSQAKLAVDNNNIPKAEQLFQDVLLILPSEQGARKQLAALWFGRQSYQAALGLLAQGIELDAMDDELRLLKAQIHIRRQQHFAAFQVLQAHPALDTIIETNYHAVLANQAQRSQQYQYAISAYLRLTGLQQHIGRWWLGLGIAYDSHSQFTLAKKTYRTALNKYDLSSSAREFVNQRLQELGD